MFQTRALQLSALEIALLRDGQKWRPESVDQAVRAALADVGQLHGHAIGLRMADRPEIERNLRELVNRSETGVTVDQSRLRPTYQG